jgi:hypothetical protein
MVCEGHVRDAGRGERSHENGFTGCATSAAATGSYTSSVGCGLRTHTHCADAPPYGCSAGHSLRRVKANEMKPVVVNCNCVSVLLQHPGESTTFTLKSFTTKNLK